MEGIINNIRIKSGNFILKRHLKNQVRKVVTHSLDTTETAGILFEASSHKSMKLVKELIKDLSSFNIKSQAIGYIHGDRRDVDYIGDKTFSFISKKDFSFFYQIKDENTISFINQPFNLLIVFCQHNYFPIQYIGTLSKSSLKVGKTGIIDNVLDMMIELSPDVELSVLKKQLLHYLSLLGKPKEKPNGKKGLKRAKRI